LLVGTVGENPRNFCCLVIMIMIIMMTVIIKLDIFDIIQCTEGWTIKKSDRNAIEAFGMWSWHKYLGYG